MKPDQPAKVAMTLEAIASRVGCLEEQVEAMLADHAPNLLEAARIQIITAQGPRQGILLTQLQAKLIEALGKGKL